MCIYSHLFRSDSLLCLGSLGVRHLDVMAFIPGNHKDTIQRLCFYNQKLGARLFFSIIFPIKAAVFHYPSEQKVVFLHTAWTATSTHFTYTENIFLPLLPHARLISDVTYRWLVNSWNSGVLFFFFFPLPHCIPVSTNWRSVHQRERRKWNETDRKQAVCCWCPTERDSFEMSCSTWSYIWH